MEHLHNLFEVIYTLSDDLIYCTETKRVPIPSDSIFVLNSMSLYHLWRYRLCLDIKEYCFKKCIEGYKIKKKRFGLSDEDERNRRKINEDLRLLKKSKRNS